MLLSTCRRFMQRALRPRPGGSRRRSPRLQCEALEPRWQPSQLRIDTGLPDGRIGTISEPPNAHNSQVEFETADDFTLPTAMQVRNATFTGLLTGGATLNDVSNVFVTIYRVFPNDSDLTRTPNVPTRNNSPADNEIENRDSAANELAFQALVVNDNFTAEHSVSSADKIAVGSGGNGAVSGEEVTFTLKFQTPLDLAAGHYFFVPKVGLSDQAPAGSDFLWLSAPRVVAPPSPNKVTPPDLQTWMRNDPGLAPDWLRVGADIIGGTTFNGSFSLYATDQPAQGVASLDSLTAPLATLPQPKDTFGAGEKPGLVNDLSQLGSDQGSAKDGKLTKENPQKDTSTPGSNGLHHSTNTKTEQIDQGINGEESLS